MTKALTRRTFLESLAVAFGVVNVGASIAAAKPSESVPVIGLPGVLSVSAVGSYDVPEVYSALYDDRNYSRRRLAMRSARLTVQCRGPYPDALRSAFMSGTRHRFSVSLSDGAIEFEGIPVEISPATEHCFITFEITSAKVWQDGYEISF